MHTLSFQHILPLPIQSDQREVTSELKQLKKDYFFLFVFFNIFNGV